MLYVKTKYSKFLLCNSYADITIKQYAKLFELDIPSFLKEAYIAKDINLVEFYKKITEKQLVEVAKFAGEVIVIFSNIKQIDKLTQEERLNLYCSHLEFYVVEFLRGFYFAEDKEIKDYFIFKNKRYELPNTLEVLNNKIYAHNLKAYSFTEATQILEAIYNLKTVGFEAIAEFVAVFVVNKKDNKQIADLIKEFEDLTLDIVKQVFFYIQKLLTMQYVIMQIYIQKQTKMIKLKMLLQEVRLAILSKDLRYLKLASKEFLATLQM